MIAGAVNTPLVDGAAFLFGSRSGLARVRLVHLAWLNEKVCFFGGRAGRSHAERVAI